jgi:L-rhamnose mutarotase
MNQAAFHLVLEPEMGQRYIDLHSPVPREIAEQLQEAGISNFSIFRDGDHIFGVFDYESESRLHEYLKEDVSPNWTREIISICKYREVDAELPLLKRLPRVFRFEGR